jgi:hypothetical protein
MMPEDMGGLPPGADVESRGPRYKKPAVLFPIPQNTRRPGFAQYPESRLEVNKVKNYEKQR